MKCNEVITDEEIKTLKELCDKATQGDWWCDSHGHAVFAFNEKTKGDSNGETVVTVFEAKNYHKKAVRHPETGNLSYWRNDWDASYIPTASPRRIKQLIERMEKAEARVKELEQKTVS